MKLNTWLRPLWSVISRAVKLKLHEMVDSVDEQEITRFKMKLHDRIERL